MIQQLQDFLKKDYLNFDKDQLQEDFDTFKQIHISIFSTGARVPGETIDLLLKVREKFSNLGL